MVSASAVVANLRFLMGVTPGWFFGGIAEVFSNSLQ
jgi:hypothetical protein